MPGFDGCSIPKRAYSRRTSSVYNPEAAQTMRGRSARGGGAGSWLSRPGPAIAAGGIDGGRVKRSGPAPRARIRDERSGGIHGANGSPGGGGEVRKEERIQRVAAGRGAGVRMKRQGGDNPRAETQGRGPECGGRNRAAGRSPIRHDSFSRLRKNSDGLVFWPRLGPCALSFRTR